MAGYGKIFNAAGATTNYRNLLSNRHGLQKIQPYAALNTKALEKLGIPPKPKRPLTPYFKFMNLKRNKVTEENPNLRGPAIVKIMAKMWANADPKEKSELQKAYDVEVLAYSKQIMTYEQSITPEQKKIIREAKDKQHDKSEKMEMKKRNEQLGRPKRPPTAFLQFMHERKTWKDSNSKISKDWVKDIADQWRQMTLEEKSKYQVESQKLMEQYKKDMKEWEEKMVREGHIDVVRNRGLIDIKVKTNAAKTQ